MSEHLISSMLVCPNVGQDYPKIINGKGIYLYDESGKEYIDASGGAAAVTSIGHADPGVVKILTEQASSVSLIPSHYFSTRILEEYTELLVKFAPEGFSKAWTVTSGTEAVENAIKVALQYHQIVGNKNKYKVVGRWESYHGNSIYTLDIGGMKLRRASYNHLMNNKLHIPASFCYRCPYGLTKNNCSIKCASALEEKILEEGPETIAAFIAEPVVGAAIGAVPAPEGYFKKIREICDRYNVLFISDEVMSGFGRTGKNFGIQHWNVIPDIIASGKSISGGYFPLSAVLLHSKVGDVFEQTKTPFLGGHTYACNPLGAAVGKYVLNFIQEKNLVENAYKLGEVFLKKLSRLKQYDIIGDVRGLGLLVGVEIVKDKVTLEPFPPELNIGKLISDEAFARGLVLYPGRGSVNGEKGNHILIAPPLIITEEQIETIVSIMDDSIRKITSELSIAA